MADTTEAEDIAAIAYAAANPMPLQAATVYSVIVPDGAHRETVDTQCYADRPARKKGNVELHDAASFRIYVQAHRLPRHTAVYANVRSSQIVAVLDGHAQQDDGPDALVADAPGWGEHRAELTLEHTANWLHWTRKDRQWMSQVQFAEHVEEGLVDIHEPPAADMLEIAQHFHATNKVSFKSSSLLHNGQRQFAYEETVEAKAGQKGTFAVPQQFLLGLAVFEGQAEAHGLSARLQFRLNGGDLSVRYLLDRAHDVKRAAFETVVAEIEDPLGLLAYRGAPPE